MEKTSPRRPEDSWSRLRLTHLFKAKSGDFGVSTFFPSEEEARAWAAYAQGILVNKWRWTSLDWELAR